MAQIKEVAHLFSGGTDSTYAAALLTGTFDKIHLITYDRFGFENVENSKIYANVLIEKYGSDKISHTIINYEKEFKMLCFKNQFSDLFKYGFYVLTNCGLCKLAMDWRTIIYCIDNNIKYVSTGSGKEMVFDPSQDRDIIKGIRELYSAFGIQYLTPGYDVSPSAREEYLFQMGIAKRLRVKWSADTWSLQPRCRYEYMNLFLIQYFCNKKTGLFDTERDEKFLEYRRNMSIFHTIKREEIKQYVKDYIAGKKKNNK